MTLMELMADMRLALRSGNLAALEGISGRIEATVPDVAALSKDELAALGRMAAENADALDAARQGIRSARRRIAEIAAAEKGLTYDRNGMRAGLATRAASLRF